ncbi:DNA-directed RNA polymerase subunit [Plakobranchus ocellatus]|uniref:DNA-directed RNA polymerase subunit n=1 Tax=Plakobranchus ocellatus TaxID=259542 RepID=A0AAV3Z2A4_9GAST|nr:DNA-directed RNA polymerase subunit [Plakobranchus ocellatus]
MEGSFDPLKNAYLEKEADEFVERVRAFVTDVKEALANDHFCASTKDGTMTQACTFLRQPLPSVIPTDGQEAMFQNNRDCTYTSLTQIKREMVQMKQDIFSLQMEKESMNHFTSMILEERMKRRKLKEDYKRLAAEFKQVKSTHLQEVALFNRCVARIRKYIKNIKAVSVFKNPLTTSTFRWTPAESKPAWSVPKSQSISTTTWLAQTPSLSSMASSSPGSSWTPAASSTTTQISWPNFKFKPFGSLSTSTSAFHAPAIASSSTSASDTSTSLSCSPTPQLVSPVSSACASTSTTYSPQPPSYSPKSPSYTPISPTYSPTLPFYSPASSSYSPKSPSYTPISPTYSPTLPFYSPASPSYSPKSPSYTPISPTIPFYSPASPSYSPKSPSYTPISPTYSPTLPFYSPASPSYSPTSPSFSPTPP